MLSALFPTVGRTVLVAALTAVLWPLLVSADRLPSIQAPEVIEGATALTLDFSPRTEEGDWVSFVQQGREQVVFQSQLPAGKDAVRMPGPSEAGRYDVIWSREDGAVKGRTALGVEPADAWINGPAAGRAGKGILIQWHGPGFEGDSILLYREGLDLYLAEAPIVRGRNPVLLPLDVEPGSYEVRYWYAATQAILAQEFLTVE